MTTSLVAHISAQSITYASLGRRALALLIDIPIVVLAARGETGFVSVSQRATWLRSVELAAVV